MPSSKRKTQKRPKTLLERFNARQKPNIKNYTARKTTQEASQRFLKRVLTRAAEEGYGPTEQSYLRSKLTRSYAPMWLYNNSPRLSQQQRKYTQRIRRNIRRGKANQTLRTLKGVLQTARNRLTEMPREYDIHWNGEKISARLMLDRLAQGQEPDILTIFHPDEGELLIENLYDEYEVRRRNSMISVIAEISPGFGQGPGERLGIVRNLQKFLRNRLPGLTQQAELTRYRASSKLESLRLQGLEKSANVFEQQTGETVPDEVRNILGSFIRSAPVPRVYYEDRDFLSRIKPSVFENDEEND